MADDVKRTDSGIEVKPLYTAADLAAWDPDTKLGAPGKPPYTRGIYPTMYRGRLWTMRQYAGFGSAESTNLRFKFLLDAGQTGLSCAFDLPTQMGYDSDHPRAEGEVGKVGVAIDSLEDMRLLLDGIPLDKVTTSMTINSTAAILLLMYELVAEEQGVPSTAIKRHDPERSPQGVHRARDVHLSAAPVDAGDHRHLRLLPRHASRTGTRSRSPATTSARPGSTAVQEIAFTLANGIAYVDAAIAAGLDVDDFAPRLSFFWNAHNNFFEEVAKFRAARRIWYRLMDERFGAKKESSKLLRFHTQTGGSTLTAQQPEANIARVAVQSMAAVMGGTQSLHTNGYDEALSLPTERAARIALRTQQIIGYESGIVDTPDPLAGSYFVESLTDEVERLAWEYIEKIDGLGGAVAAIEASYQMDEIEQAAYEYAKSIDDGERVIVGVNRFALDTEPEPVVFPIDPELQANQIARVKRFKAERDQGEVEARLEAMRVAAKGTASVMPPMRDALAASATLGEVSDALRDVFGVHRPN